MRSTGDVAELLHDWQQVLTDLAKIDFGELSDPAKLDALRDLQPLIWAGQAQYTRLIAAVHASAAVGHDGYSSTRAWMRAHLRATDGVAHMRAAKALALTPRVGEVYARGECSLEHVRAVAAVIDDIPAKALADVDTLLAGQAGVLDAKDYATFATELRDRIDPDAADRRYRQRLESRWLSTAKTLDNVVSIKGVLDPDSGELLLNTLGALMPPPCAGDLRTAAQRRADALLDLCRLAGDSAPVAGGQKPHVTVTVDLDTLRAQLGNPGPVGSTGPVNTGDGCADPGRADHPGRRANPGEADSTHRWATPSRTDGPPDRPHQAGHDPWGGARLGSGTLIGAETARRLACDAVLIPIVLGSASEPLDVGRAHRLVTWDPLESTCRHASLSIL